MCRIERSSGSSARLETPPSWANFSMRQASRLMVVNLDREQVNISLVLKGGSATFRWSPNWMVICND